LLLLSFVFSEDIRSYPAHKDPITLHEGFTDCYKPALDSFLV